MSYYIIIRGPLGIGKSTVSRNLANILNGAYVSVDDVLEENGLDQVDENEGKIPVKNFIKGNEIVLSKIKQYLDDGKVVIIDGNFYHREQIEHFENNLPFKQYVFTLKAPLEVCIARDVGRKNSYGQDATTAVYNLVSAFDYGTAIDTENKTVQQTVKNIISYLD